MIVPAKHTSGPWLIGESYVDDDVREVPICVMVKTPFGSASLTPAVALDGLGPGVQDANAALIAAAPDLLEALRLAEQALFAVHATKIARANGGNEDESAPTASAIAAVLERGRDAIAKAEGRS